MVLTDVSRKRETKGSHCSENLTKLIKAERIERVRSGSGAERSFAEKSGMRAEAAKRVLEGSQRHGGGQEGGLHVVQEDAM